MIKLTSLGYLKTLLSNIVDGQFVSFEDELTHSFKLFEQNQLEDEYLKTTLSLLQCLFIMHKENLIDTEQFNSRIVSLRNILEMAEELSSIEKQ